MATEPTMRRAPAPSRTRQRDSGVPLVASKSGEASLVVAAQIFRVLSWCVRNMRIVAVMAALAGIGVVLWHD
ncbi:hypothetical protein AYO38_06305 [bacterium SCGC AG-212-C10]|nr:hypothetical protein AYO38_06305 [bacterium SCGC AG-212-C10]